MENVILEFKKLLDTLNQLMGDQGCAWDRQQTLVSMRSALVEEACEVIEAIDDENDQNLCEELGDLFYTLLFFSRLAEKEERFSTEEVLKRIREKIISRHPHVFGESGVKDIPEIIEQWEVLKKKEKVERESLLDGIPRGLPALVRAYKMIGKRKRAKFCPITALDFNIESEEDLGKLLWNIVEMGHEKGWNPENALRKEILNFERKFREWEKHETQNCG